MENYTPPPTSGPRSIGQLATIAAGSFTEIEIITPSEATPGEIVRVEVRVRNIRDTAFYVAVSGTYGPDEIIFGPTYFSIATGTTVSFISTFVMPDFGGRVSAWSWYWTGEEWVTDDYGEAIIELPAEVLYRGTITGLTLDYDGYFASIPAFDIPQNKSGHIHITARNDIGSAQRLGISLKVSDPDGVAIEEYSGWSALWTDPGSEGGFVSGSFSLDKLGTYRLTVALFMNPDDPLLVDYYFGNLCTVVPPVVIDGEVVLGYIWWEGKGKQNLILTSNDWPADTETTTILRVRNTGTMGAFFKIAFMGFESSSVFLNPEEVADLYLYPVTPGPGTYTYTLQIMADGQVVAEYQIEVTAVAVVQEPEFRGFSVLEYQKV